MTPWAWSWRELDDEAYGCEAATRDAVIADAIRDLSAGDAFEIIEARQSEDRKYEDTDIIPFLRTRNPEVLMVVATADGGKEVVSLTGNADTHSVGTEAASAVVTPNSSGAS